MTAQRPAKATSRTARPKPAKAPAKATKKAAKKAPPKAAAKVARPAAPAKSAKRPNRRAEHLRRMAKAEHDHQDPRVYAGGSPKNVLAHDPRDPRKDGGAIKNRAVARMNPTVNWFRRGAHPPSR